MKHQPLYKVVIVIAGCFGRQYESVMQGRGGCVVGKMCQKEGDGEQAFDCVPEC